MKRRIWKLLAVITVLAVFSTVMASAAGSDKFTDIPSNSWYKGYVDYVVDNNYMNGTSDTTFSPEDNLTRAMVVTVLARYDGAAVDNSKATVFTDVPVDQWYTGSVGWANENGIVEGTGDGVFSPNTNVTRQDLCVMIERYITYVETNTDKVHVTPGVAITFTDEGQIASYAKSAVDKAVIHGLVDGYPDGSFKPANFATRAEFAAIISRIAWEKGDGQDSHDVKLYDADGNLIETVTVKTGETYTIPAGPTKVGFNFIGWNTSADGSGTTYHPGEKILLTNDLALYPQYKARSSGGGPDSSDEETTDTYLVKLQFTAAEMGDLELATEEYTEDQTWDQVLKDLIAGDNEDAITNAVGTALDKIKDQTWKGTIGENNYMVQVDENWVISAKRNSEPVNLGTEFLEAEQAVFDSRMDTIKKDFRITDAAWDSFVEATAPTNFFTVKGDTLVFKTPDEYYTILADAVDAAVALHEALGIDCDWEALMNAVITFKEGEDIIGINTLMQDEDEVLFDLPYSGIKCDLFNVQDSITTDVEEAMANLDARTSRDISNSEIAQALLASGISNGNIVGDYTVTVWAEKN